MNKFLDTTRLSGANVSSVPQRSPLRYPGGKSWLIPTLRRWIASQSSQDKTFFEPFAGGGSASLSAVMEGWAPTAVLCEKDPDVAALWYTLTFESQGCQRLARRILDFDLTCESVDDLLEAPIVSTFDRAFVTIIRNRVNRGGILAPGVGRMRGGENGKGITSRWYPETLAKRIMAISAVRDRLHFIEDDGVALMERVADMPRAIFFIDPPYTAGGKSAGSRLYTYSEVDHSILFATVAQLKGDFLMTYDLNDEVRALAEQSGFQTHAIGMKSTHHAKLTELLISRDLWWMDTSTESLTELAHVR